MIVKVADDFRCGFSIMCDGHRLSRAIHHVRTHCALDRCAIVNPGEGILHVTNHHRLGYNPSLLNPVPSCNSQILCLHTHNYVGIPKIPKKEVHHCHPSWRRFFGYCSVLFCVVLYPDYWTQMPVCDMWQIPHRCQVELKLLFWTNTFRIPHNSL